MTQDIKKISLIVIGIFILAFIFSSYIVVSETDQYIITRFGKPVREPLTTAGLHFKLPFIEKAIQLDKRILQWDGYPNQIPTRDKKYIIVDTTARWQITDPLKFIETVRTEKGAQTRLDDIIDSATREAISRHNLVETVRNTNQIIDKTLNDDDVVNEESDEERLALDRVQVGRENIQKMILNQATSTIAEYGIKLIDVRIKRLNYEQSVQQKVFERMISERKRIAEKLRSEGIGKKSEIEGRMNRELNKIDSEAYKKSQEIKGEAEATSTAIYANAYNMDPDLFDFYRTMETYQKTLNDKVILFLSSDGEYLRLLNQ